MKVDPDSNKSGAFEKFATHAARAAGSTYAFTMAVVVVFIWAICGPFFDYSETWQLVINTGTTIITFLMVFLIQKAQNKDSLAIQLKLNELVASSEYASNRLVDIENMTEDEMMIVQKYYRSLSELSKKDESLKASHSIEEAEDQHEVKSNKIKQRTSRSAKKNSNHNAAQPRQSRPPQNLGPDSDSKPRKPNTRHRPKPPNQERVQTPNPDANQNRKDTPKKDGNQ